MIRGLGLFECIVVGRYCFVDIQCMGLEEWWNNSASFTLAQGLAT